MLQFMMKDIVTSSSEFYVHDHGSWEAICLYGICPGQVVDLTQNALL